MWNNKKVTIPNREKKVNWKRNLSVFVLCVAAFHQYKLNHFKLQQLIKNVLLIWFWGCRNERVTAEKANDARKT